jgi:hypothetical protein
MAVDKHEDFAGIPSRVRARLKGYRFWSAVLVILVVLLGVVSVVSALIAATFTDELKGGSWLKVLTFISAVSVSLLNAFNLQGKASDVWSAFRHLEYAVLEYSEGGMDKKQLLSAYKEAENMVKFVGFKAKNEEQP